jgi:glutaredoxin
MDREAAAEIVQKTRQRGVPVIKVGERYIVGFDQSAIDSALRDAGLI